MSSPKTSPKKTPTKPAAVGSVAPRALAFTSPHRRFAPTKSVVDLRLARALPDLPSTPTALHSGLTTPLKRFRPSSMARQMSSVDVRSPRRLAPVPIIAEPQKEAFDTPPSSVISHAPFVFPRRQRQHEAPSIAPKLTFERPSSPITRSVSRNSLLLPPSTSTSSSVIQSTSPPTTTGSTTDSIPASVSTSRSVRFANLSVLYFDRCQGGDTVPQAGEITLGMEANHFAEKNFYLRDERVDLCLEPEEQNRYLSTETAKTIVRLGNKERAKLLKKSGVKIERPVDNELETLRVSRMECGCRCPDGACFPDTCQCYLDGVQCQVDGLSEATGESYPCSCTRELCANTAGRLEYDPQAVHLHNITKIKMYRDMNKLQNFDSPTLTKFDSDDEQEVLPEHDGEINCNHHLQPRAVPVSPRLPLGALKSRRAFTANVKEDATDSAEHFFTPPQRLPLQKRISRVHVRALPEPDPEPSTPVNVEISKKQDIEKPITANSPPPSPRKFPKVGSLL